MPSRRRSADSPLPVPEEPCPPGTDPGNWAEAHRRIGDVSSWVWVRDSEDMSCGDGDIYCCDLTGLGLTSIPQQIRERTNLEGLDLGTNRLKIIPAWLGELSNLRLLGLTSNPISELPWELAQLGLLEVLWLGKTHLAAIPDWVGSFRRLSVILLDDLQLLQVPEVLRQVKSLQVLSLDNNELKLIPEWLGDLACIDFLSLKGNCLRSLPDSLVQLKKLRRLDLRDNDLQLLPACLNNLPLNLLLLHGNPALGLSDEALGPQSGPDVTYAKPADILRAYYAAQRAAGPLREVKMILLGRGEAGKTTIVDYLLTGAWQPQHAETLGVELADWKVDRAPLAGPVTAHVWDFAGAAGGTRSARLLSNSPHGVCAGAGRPP